MALKTTRTTEKIPDAVPDPDALYEALIPTAIGDDVFNPGVSVRGDHPAVMAHFDRFVLADAPDDEKRRLRGQRLWARTDAEHEARYAAAWDAVPYAELPTGRYQAIRSWRLRDPEFADRARIEAGEIVDASDERFRRYPHLFNRLWEDRSR